MANTSDYIRIRDGLTRLDNALPEYVQSQGCEPRPRSPADIERTGYQCKNTYDTIASIGLMLLESVGEHFCILIRAMHEPITPYACWTCARSMLEPAAITAWLFDPKISAHQRVSRSFAYRFEGLQEQLKFVMSAGVKEEESVQILARIDQLEQKAVSLGMPTLRNSKGKRDGVGERMPSATIIIKMALNDEIAYRLFSAIAHSHSWALQQLGYEKLDYQRIKDGDKNRSVAVQKTAGNIKMHLFACSRSVNAYALPVWYQCLYFGWDKQILINLLESVYDDIGMQPITRFWR